MAESPSVAQLADLLRTSLQEVRAGQLLVLTGAGVSHASGIPTFRGEDEHAIWKRDVTELGTFAYFRDDPAGSWSWYLHRFASLDVAEPNEAHIALAELEEWQVEGGGRFLLVSQNIDTLHERAGSERLVKVHGSSDRVRCPQWGCRHGAPEGSLARSRFDLTPFELDPRALNLPRCPECGTLLRQHVLWFDESYTDHGDYGFSQVLEAADEMDLLLCIGTSFSVGITELLLQSASTRGVPVLSIDPADSAHLVPWHSISHLRAPAEVLLPSVCQLLGTRPEDPNPPT